MATYDRHKIVVGSKLEVEKEVKERDSGEEIC